MSNDMEHKTDTDLRVIRETLEALFEQRENSFGRVPEALRALDRVLAASAGSEPVAWRHRMGPTDTWVECSKEFHDWVLREPDAWPGNEVQALYTHPSPPDGMVGGWRPIADAPKTGQTLLLGYFNSANRWRTTRGQWMSQDYIDEYAEEPELMEPGWHETTVEDDDGKSWPIEPTHYMPAPAPPIAAGGGKEASNG